MSIPLVDLKWQHNEIADEVSSGLEEVMANTAFVQGPAVSEFEQNFAEFIGVEHCVGVGNGTDALELGLRALGIGHGDVVLLPANTFIASALGVLRAGADVALVDCDPDSYLIDVERISDALSPDVKAIMPVHLYGQLAPMEQVLEVAGDVHVIEDAAQSQGATRHGLGSGSFGVVAGTSFYPGKNIGAYGDGGAVLTNDLTMAEQVRKLGNWGSSEKYHHPEIGFNSRLDTVQAVVLDAKLSRLREWNELRGRAAKLYDQLLDGTDVQIPLTLDGNVHAWHLYVIQVDERDRILRSLNEAGIGAGIHYPVPVHLHGATQHLGYSRGDFPVAEAAAERILSLPLFPGITESQQEQVVSVLMDALGGR